MIWSHQLKQTLHISRIDATDIFLNDLLMIHLTPSLRSYSLPTAYAQLKRKATTCHFMMAKHNPSRSIPSLERRPADERKNGAEVKKKSWGEGLGLFLYPIATQQSVWHPASRERMDRDCVRPLADEGAHLLQCRRGQFVGSLHPALAAVRVPLYKTKRGCDITGK